MEIEIPQLIAYLLAWFGTISGVWFLFEKAESVLTQGSISTLAAFLRRAEIKTPNAVPATFIRLFDGVLGENLFTLSAFLRSFLVSSFSVTLVAMFWMIQSPDASLAGIWIAPLLSLAFGVLANLVPDYLSLIQTRMFLNFLEGMTSTSALILVVIADAIFTSMLSYASIVFFVTIAGEPVPSLYALVQFRDSNNFFLSIFWYSAFFTSLWLWLYIISAYIVRGVNSLNRSLFLFKNSFDIDGKPLRVMGLFAVGMVSVVFLVIPFL